MALPPTSTRTSMLKDINAVRTGFHTDCSLAPREKRILDRGVNVYFHREASKADRTKIDEKVKEYYKLNPTEVRRESISAAKFPLPTLSHTKKPSISTNFSFHLPNEINYQILAHLTAPDSQRSEGDPSYREYCSLCYLKTLYNCCLISKSWNGAATATLYSKLKLDLDGTCEYHWRGIPWGDGVLWWIRRTSYLRDRYLKLLLRTLTARPELTQYFRTLEIDLHYHIPSDYKVLPMYTKLISLCPNLTTMVGDPCIFFAPIDPYMESISLDLLNFFSRGHLHRGKQMISVRNQKKLWKVLSEHTAWESWEWTAQCQKIQLPAFHRFHQNWKSLKHLSVVQLHYEPGNSPSEMTTNPIACLDALESLSLSNTGLRFLQSVPVNKLTTLSVEVLGSNSSGITFQEDLAELWAYLSKCSNATSRLKKLSIRSIATRNHLTWKLLPKTLSLAPNLLELSASFPYTPNNNYVVLVTDPSVVEIGIWQTAFPRCAKLQKLSFLCPGWSHNRQLLKVLRMQPVFPSLRELEYYRSTAVVELTQIPAAGQPSGPQSTKSKSEGDRIDSSLEVEFRKRNLAKISDAQENLKVHLKKTMYK